MAAQDQLRTGVSGRAAGNASNQYQTNLTMKKKISNAKNEKLLEVIADKLRNKRVTEMPSSRHKQTRQLTTVESIQQQEGEHLDLYYST